MEGGRESKTERKRERESRSRPHDELCLAIKLGSIYRTPAEERTHTAGRLSSSSTAPHLTSHSNTKTTSSQSLWQEKKRTTKKTHHFTLGTFSAVVSKHKTHNLLQQQYASWTAGEKKQSSRDRERKLVCVPVFQQTTHCVSTDYWSVAPLIL